MDCPYCSKDVYGMTGFQEAQAFAKHLRKCRKYRQACEAGDKSGKQPEVRPERVDLMTAVNLRAESGQ